MTSQLTKRQRELQLVSMMLTDRSLLHREFRQLTGYDPQMVFDRDMVRLILSREYPTEDECWQRPRPPR